MLKKNAKAAEQLKSGPASECETESLEKAARRIGISRASAYNYAKAGKLPVIRLGRRLLVPKAALDKLLQVTT